MSEVPLLRRFSALRTSDPDEVLAWMRPVFAIHEIDMPRGERRFDSIVNHRALDSLSLTYASYGTPLTARLRQNDYFVQGFPISGSGEVRWNRHTVAVSTASGGIVGGPGAEARVAYDGRFSHLMIRFSTAALTRKLSAMLGKPVDPPLRIDGSSASNPEYLAGQQRLVRFLVEELDRVDEALPAVALAEIEQAIIVNYLVAHPHNYSHWLMGTPRTIGPSQVRAVAEYIEQNWDQPITIEALSQITQISTRSLFHLFKRTYGVSPMVFARRIRMQHARVMLSHPTPETSVTSVGFRCGFSNLGNFGRAYFNAFGEKPSETLRNAR